jgi:transcription antitermination factor NusG
MSTMLDREEPFRVHGETGGSGAHELRTGPAAAVGGRSPRWYVALIKPGCEERAAKRLREQKFEVFCPMIERPVTRARDRHAMLAEIARAAGRRKRGRPPKARKPQLMPALRGYLFVHLDLELDRWHLIRSTGGVLSSEEEHGLLCMTERRPFAIPDHQVAILQREVMTAGAKADLAKALLKAGETVRVLHGPFTSFPGVVVEQDGDRVTIRVQIFGRETPVELFIHEVERP